MFIDIWNNNTLLFLENDVFECRLVPLNKNHPNLPNENQFQPISIISPLLKLLEIRFIEKIN